MKPEVMLELLEAFAEQLKVRVSYEPLQTSVVHGGLCRVKGEYRIIVDKRASAEERVATLATAVTTILGRMTELDRAALELSPKLRDVLRMYDQTPRAPGASATRQDPHGLPRAKASRRSPTPAIDPLPSVTAGGRTAA
jgi:hypothetical protein